MRLPGLSLKIFRGLALGLGSLALLAELAQVGGVRQAAAARAALDGEQWLAARAAAEAARRWAPWQTEAGYYQLVALKRLGLWAALAQTAQRTARWHPDRVSVLDLLAEAAWNTNQAPLAANAVWDSLWLAPRPARNAVSAWRLALLAGQATWGDRDSRVTAAAVRVLALLERERDLPPEIARAARAEAAAALAAAGAPLTARAAQPAGPPEQRP